MTQNKKWKRAVRERMARTGESYSTARANMLKEKAPGSSPEPEAKDKSAPAEYLAGQIYPATVFPNSGMLGAQHVAKARTPSAQPEEE